MNCQLSQSSACIQYSLPERFVASFGEASRAAIAAFQSAWRKQAVTQTQANALELMADIDEHTLRDIGAPNWLIAQAVERKDAYHLRLLELHRS